MSEPSLKAIDEARTRLRIRQHPKMLSEADNERIMTEASKVEEEWKVGCTLPRQGNARHRLKTWPKSFSAVLNGSKRYELRKNDRCFKVGDELRLEEWDPEDGFYTGNYLVAKVTYITPGGHFGLPQDLCVLSIVVEEWATPNYDALTDL